MMRDQRQIAVLARVGRRARMWRLQALQDLADALGEEGRATDLERRSRALAAGYSQTAAETGAMLRDQAHVGTQLAQVTKQAEGFREAAAQRSETARLLLSRASEQADDLDRRVAQARQQLAQRRDRKEQSVQHNLARNLLNSPMKVLAKSKEGSR